MQTLRNSGFASLACFALVFLACESANAPEESASPVVGKWTGRYEAKDYGITVNVLLQINPDHTYRAHAYPNVTGMDSVHVYEEDGEWSIAANAFIAAKLSCRIVNPSDMVLKDTACAPSDTSAIEIIGDSLWTGKLRGQPMTLTRKK
jgi:hypothetical protein